MPGFFGGGSTQTVVEGRPLTAAEKRLINVQGALGNFALDVLKGIRGDLRRFGNIADSDDFRGALQTFNSLQRAAGRDFDQARQLSRQLNNQLGNAAQKLGTGGASVIRAIQNSTALRRNQGVNISPLGGQTQFDEIDDIELEATQQDIDLINSIAADQIALGRSDIEDATRTAIEDIRDILTPSRGLRPGDSPIISQADRAAAEGLRQQGQLIRGVRASATQELANRPFQRAGLQLQQEGLELSRDQAIADQNLAFAGLGLSRDQLRSQQNIAIRGLNQSGAQLQLGAAQTGLGFLQGTTQFNTQRAQQAFQNQSSIAGIQAQLPLDLLQLRAGVGTGIQPQIGSALSAIAASQGQTQSGSTSGNFATGLQNTALAAGGIGALFQGLTAAGILSDRNKKTHIRGIDNVDMDRMLQSFRDLGIAQWTYKDEEPGAPVHIGPYAQDFHREFGFSDPHHINIIDALGILFAGLKAAIARIDVLEDELDG